MIYIWAMITTPPKMFGWCIWMLCVALKIGWGYFWRTIKGICIAANLNIAKGLEAKSKAHGDADFATEQELKERGHFERKGWLVGVVHYRRWIAWGYKWPFYRKVRKLVYTHPEASGLAVAGKGQGKTQTGISQLKDIAFRPKKEDVVIVDPAGDLCLGLEQTFRDQGYKVIKLDFENIEVSDWHDPITFLRTENPAALERDIYQLVDLMMPDDGQQQNEHFQEFPRLMVAGVMAYMALHEKQNLTLRNVAVKLTMNIEQRDELLRKMATSDHPLIQQAVTAYKGAGDKERGSFGTTMARKLQFCMLTGIKAITQSDEFHESGIRVRGWSWADIYLGEQPTVVFIITGLGMSQKGKGESDVARILLGTAINARRYVYGELRKHARDGRVRFNRDLRIFVDEAKKIGNCQAIMDANDELRKAQVTTMMYFLSSRDIYTTYPQAVTLIENSDLLIFGGSKEKSWMEDVSWMVGDKTLANRSGSADGDNENFSEQPRRVKKSDEIRRMGFKRLLYIDSFNSAELDKPFKLDKKGVTHIHGL